MHPNEPDTLFASNWKYDYERPISYIKSMQYVYIVNWQPMQNKNMIHIRGTKKLNSFFKGINYKFKQKLNVSEIQN